MSVIQRFLTGEGRDGAGRSLDDVLGLDDQALEHRHDFIQWLFPLAEASAAVPGSPVLTPADVEALRGSEAAQRNLRGGAQRMLRFYAETPFWLTPMDHNHLRITRIIRSLRLLAGDAEADAFKRRITALAEARGARINATSLRYWEAA